MYSDFNPRCHLKKALAPVEEEGISMAIFTRRMTSSETTTTSTTTSTTSTTTTTSTSTTSTSTSITTSMHPKNQQAQERKSAEPVVISHTGEIATLVGLSAILLALLVIALSLTVVICRRFPIHKHRTMFKGKIKKKYKKLKIRQTHTLSADTFS